MRTLLMLALACATGCDQITTPQPSHVRWTSHHDGVELWSAGKVLLVPDRGDAIDVFHVRLELAPHTGSITGDTSDATLQLPGQAGVHPIAVNARNTTLPIARADDRHAETLVDSQLMWTPEADFSQNHSPLAG